MGAKSYILMALPIVFLVGFLALFIWIGRRRPLRFTALANKLGLRPGMQRADEMERLIQYKAISIAYTVMLFGLLGCTLYSVFVKNESMPLSNGVLLLGVLTQSIATLALRHRYTEGDEEYKPYPLWKTLLIVLVFGLAVGALGAMLAIGIMMI